MNNVFMVLIVLVLAASFVAGLSFWMDYDMYQYNKKSAQSEPWAFGSADDAIKIIETIRSDPERSDAESVHSGPNRGSWYISAAFVRFRDVRLVYNSFKDYRIVKRWLKRNPAIEPTSNPTW